MKEQKSLSLSLSLSLFLSPVADVYSSSSAHNPVTSALFTNSIEPARRMHENRWIYERLFKDNFLVYLAPPKKEARGPTPLYWVRKKFRRENRDDDDNARVGKRERTGATVFMDMVVNMLTGFGMCVVCVRKYACVCVLRFWVYWETIGVFFPYLSKGGQSRFGTFVSKSWFKVSNVVAWKKSKKFQIQKAKEQPPPSFVSNLLTFRTLSERGR